MLQLQSFVYNYFINEYVPNTNNDPTLAQLVERRTVVGLTQLSLGHWFESGRSDLFLFPFFMIKRCELYRLC